MNDKVPLSVSGLAKAYEKNFVLRGVSLELRAGEIFGLVGLNGVGKTTLIKSILDLTRPDQGAIALFGLSPADEQSRKRLCYLPEKFQPSRYLTGWEYILLSLSYFGRKPDPTRTEAMAESLDLRVNALDERVSTYSKGMGQKLGLLAALLADTPLLILDEPMSGLDPRARILLKQALVDARKAGKTIFFSSHILSDIDEICDRIGILQDGVMRYLGTPSDFRADYPGLTLEKAFLACIDEPGEKSA